MYRCGCAWIVCGVLSAFVLAPLTAEAQATGQVWINATFDWRHSHRLTFAVDFEPKLLVSAPPDDPGWWSLDLTPSVDFGVTNWLDLIGELLVAETSQADVADTSELTGRIGARFHPFSRLAGLLPKEKTPRRRLVIQDFVRAELRNLFYSDSTPTESVVRFRNRLEVLFPLNRRNVTDTGAAYLTTDWEWYIPLSDPGERFANRHRIRAGVGLRRSTAWRYAALYIVTRSRDTRSDPFTTTEHIFDFQIKRVW